MKLSNIDYFMHFIQFYVIATTVKHVGSRSVNYNYTEFYLILKVFDGGLCWLDL